MKKIKKKLFLLYMALQLGKKAASGLVKVPLNAVKTGTDLANAGIVNTGKIGVGVLDIAGTTFDTTSKVYGNAAGMTADASASARSINKHALDTVVNAAQTSGIVSGHLMKLTGDATGSTSRLASTSIDQSSNVAMGAVTTFAKASIALLSTVDSVTTGFGNSLDRSAKTHKALYTDYQAANFKNKLQGEFNNNIEKMVKALQQFVYTKDEFIRGRFEAYRAKKCTQGKMYGRSCDASIVQFLQRLESELNSLNIDARAMAVNIRSLSSEVASVLVQVHTDQSKDLDVLRSNMQTSLAPKYEKAADVFNKAVGTYTAFEEKLIEEFQKGSAPATEPTMETAGGRRRTVRKRRRNTRRKKTGKRRLR
jgi:hypothetical protein